jgi:hypothetical protein
MREIMVKCPETGKEISTGIWCDGESFSRLPFIVSHTSCPLCGQLHGWSKADAWLSEPELGWEDQPRMTSKATAVNHEWQAQALAAVDTGNYMTA